MRRIVINLLLLMSIAAAAPNGRPKRHFSYIKNFILTTFFGDNLTPTIQIPILEPEFEYDLYRIPGFNDILIKTLKCKSDEITIVNNSGEEMEIKPFESYIGTKSIKETDVAFRNVYTLLSTGILNQPGSDILQVMVPIINGLHYEAGENLKPFRVYPNKIQPVIMNEGEIKKFPTQMNINRFNNLKRPFETIYSAPPLKKRLPLKSYQERTDEQNIMSTPNLPKLFKQMPHKVFPLATHSYQTPKEEHQENVYKDKQYILLESEHFRKNLGQRLVPLDSVASRSMHLKKPVYIGVATKDKYDKITLDDNNISKSIGTTPTPHDFLINADSTTEYNYSKTSIPKVTSTDKIINKIYNAPEDKITPPINHKHSDKLDIVKENDEISTRSPFDINNVNVLPLTTTEKELNIQTSDETITENRNNGSNIDKTSDNWPKNKTLSQYIYDPAGNNKSHSDSILEEKDKNTSVLLLVDKTSINVHNSKPSDEKLRDNLNTTVNNNSSLYSQIDNSSKINVVQANDGDVKNNDVHVIVVKSNESDINVVESNNSNITSSTEVPLGSETGRISLKESPIVETDDSAKEEWNKESQNFSESFTKGRGDIPYQ